MKCLDSVIWTWMRSQSNSLWEVQGNWKNAKTARTHTHSSFPETQDNGVHQKLGVHQIEDALTIGVEVKMWGGSAAAVHTTGDPPALG